MERVRASQLREALLLSWRTSLDGYTRNIPLLLVWGCWRSRKGGGTIAYGLASKRLGDCLEPQFLDLLLQFSVTGRALRYGVVKAFIGLLTPSLLPLESIDSTV